jgi:hypothetical protein
MFSRESFIPYLRPSSCFVLNHGLRVVLSGDRTEYGSVNVLFNRTKKQSQVQGRSYCKKLG